MEETSLSHWYSSSTLTLLLVEETEPEEYPGHGLGLTMAVGGIFLAGDTEIVVVDICDVRWFVSSRKLLERSNSVVLMGILTGSTVAGKER
jgi:hypothetical protein